MKIDVNVYLHSSGEAKLVEVLAAILKLEKKMGIELDDLKSKVQANSDVIDSAVTLLKGIKAELDAAIASNDPAALTVLSAALGAHTQQLADAIVANTP